MMYFNTFFIRVTAKVRGHLSSRSL